VAIETKSIDYIAEHERHGNVLDQGPFWFVGNFHFFTIAVGFVGPSMGLGLAASALAGTIGILFGTLFVAMHASQGPELGMPQMIQSRAQFGYRGVVVVLFGTLLTFVGFNIVNSILIARGLNGIFGWNGTAVMLGAAVIAVSLAIYGHDCLHRVFRWGFYASVPLYTVLSLAVVLGRIAPTHAPADHFSWVAFVAQFAASASFNITAAPCVSDFSRYLRRDTKPRVIIAAVFLGCAVSSIWLITLGAWLATRVGASDGLVVLRDAGNAVTSGFGTLLSLTSVAVLVATMGMNTYSAMLTAITTLNSLFGTRPSARLRILAILVILVMWIPVSLSIGGNAIDVLSSGLTIMLYLLAPWTAINLTDYFFVRRGRYAITHFFIDNGVYGKWGFRGLAAYVLGFLSAMPFIVLPDVFSGPAARALGGVDVGWLVGLIVSAGVYLWLGRRFDPESEAAAIAESASHLRQTELNPGAR
jgi:NCS1 family nucleobase:cation symporter-1